MSPKTLFSVVFIGTTFALTASACTKANPNTVFEDFENYNKRYNEIVRTYDIKGFTALYNPNPVWIDPNKPPVSGLEVPQQTLQFLADNKGLLSHTLEQVHMSDDGSQAVITGEYDAKIEAFNTHSKGTYLFVLTRDGDEWKIAVDMFNEHLEE